MATAEYADLANSLPQPPGVLPPFNKTDYAQPDARCDLAHSAGYDPYDGLNRRTSKLFDTTTSLGNQYYYNRDWQVIADRYKYSTHYLVDPWNDEYVYGPGGGDVPMVWLHDGNDDGDVWDSYSTDWRGYYTTDALGSVTGSFRFDESNTLVGTTRNVYTAYGEATRSGPDAAFDGPLYAGYFFDAQTGLSQVRNRYYDPNLSNFISRDPIGYDAGDPNLYRYVGNRVTSYVDPLGLEGYGHHYFSVERALKPILNEGLVSDNAWYFALGHYSGATHPSHRHGTYGGSSHPQYDARVQELFREYAAKHRINKDNPAKPSQIRDFVENYVKPGRKLDGSTDEILSEFNKVIAKQRAAYEARAANPSKLRRPAEELAEAEIIERGKQYARRSGLLNSRMCGLLCAGAASMIDQYAQAPAVAAKSRYFRQGLDALKRGDLPEANACFLGSEANPSRTGFYDELVDRGLWSPAARFKESWICEVKKARQRFR